MPSWSRFESLRRVLRGSIWKIFPRREASRSKTDSTIWALPLYPALYGVVKILESEGVRDRVKFLAAGKLINAGRQRTAFALGADACYTTRGFMLALGCIQARECRANTCPVRITTQDPHFQTNLDPEVKAAQVANDLENIQRDLKEMLVATGKPCPRKLSVKDRPSKHRPSKHRLGCGSRLGNYDRRPHRSFFATRVSGQFGFHGRCRLDLLHGCHLPEPEAIPVASPDIRTIRL